MEELITKMENNVGWVILAFTTFSLTLATVEFFYELYKKKIDRWRLGEMWASFSVYIVAKLLENSAYAVVFGVFFFVGQFIPWKLPINIWTTLLAILVVDFIYYWEHRMEHEIRFFWAYHSTHHSSPIYNYTTAFRVSFISNFAATLWLLPTVLLGFNPFIIFLAVGVQGAYQFWLHTELIGKMGWFEKLFMTPSQHRVHHGSDKIYLDKNYGAILNIWDKMFGTHQKELHKPTYGLTTQINTINTFKVHAYEYIAILKDLKKSKSVKEAISYIFKKPGWKPERLQKEAPQVNS